MSDPRRARARAAEAAARRELATIPHWLWDGRTLPVPIEAIVDSHYGLLVEDAADLAVRVGLEPSARVSGVLLVGERVILVDRTEGERTPARRRFTVAHELGHWVLHHAARGGVPVFCRDSTTGADSHADPASLLGYPPTELEANQFAAALLMPAPLVASLAEAGEAAAATLGVSPEALRRRRWALANLL